MSIPISDTGNLVSREDLREGLLGDLKSRLNTSTKEAQSSLGTDAVLKLIAKSMEELDFKKSLSEFLSSLALFLNCERVSFGIIHKGKAHLKGISNCIEVKRHTATASLLQAVMLESFDNRCLTLSQSKKDRAPSTCITFQHEKLKLHSGSRSVCSVPLYFDSELTSVLIIETPAQTFGTQQLKISESAFRLNHHSLILKYLNEQPLAKKAIHSVSKVGGRLLGNGNWKLKLAFIGFFSLLGFLCLVNGEHRVSASTFIEGAIQRAAVAPFHGFVREAPLRAGDIVQTGSLLCKLDDRDFRLEKLKWASQLQQLERQHQQALSGHEGAKIKIIEAQINQAKSELSAIESQIKRTLVTAPFDGVIVSGDLSHAIGAPVDKGDVLFEIAPLNDYRVVLKVDEKDIASISQDQKGQLLLSSFPTQKIPISIKSITPVSLSDNGQNYFKVEAQLDRETPFDLRPGMGGVGKIVIDKKPLIWVWTHRAIKALKLWSWSWLP